MSIVNRNKRRDKLKLGENYLRKTSKKAIQKRDLHVKSLQLLTIK
jgi:hypothetical protein